MPQREIAGVGLFVLTCLLQKLANIIIRNCLRQLLRRDPMFIVQSLIGPMRKEQLNHLTLSVGTINSTRQRSIPVDILCVHSCARVH